MRTVLEMIAGAVFVVALVFGIQYLRTLDSGPQVISRNSTQLLEQSGGRPIYVYSNKCQACSAANAFLTSNGLNDTVQAIEVKEGGAEILRQIGVTTVPTLVFADKFVLGFDDGDWKDYLSP